MKRGVKAGDHAIIYTGKVAPLPLQGENRIHKRPVRVDNSDSRRKLAPQSRVNYNKVYTVEHNVKVCFIGKIHGDSKTTFLTDFENTWHGSRKIFGRTSPSPSPEPQFQGKEQKLLEQPQKNQRNQIVGRKRASMVHMSSNKPPVDESQIQEKRLEQSPEEQQAARMHFAPTLDNISDTGPRSQSPSSSILSIYKYIKKIGFAQLANKGPVPNVIRRTSNMLWPIERRAYSKVSIAYKVLWEVPRFLKGYFPQSQRLGNVLTLTGDAKDSQALPCGEYLKNTWPRISEHILQAMEEVLQTSIKGHAETKEFKIDVVATAIGDAKPTSETFSVVFTIDANLDDHCDLASAISWVCAAVRHGNTEGLSESRVSFETIPRSEGIPEILIKLSPLVPINEEKRPVEEKKPCWCWHSLFAHTVIAHGFPISHRKEGRGLELSFQNMLVLARSLRLIEYDNGLIAEGLDNLIIPIVELQEDDALQWHLEWKTPLTLASDILAGDSFLNRYKTTDLQKLADKRTFLGWTKNALVVLGTERFNQNFPIENIRRSGASVLRNDGFRPVSYNMTVGTNAIPGLVFQGQTMIAQAFDGNYTATRKYDKIFRDRLYDSAKRNVIIANWKGQTFWYLPETSVILYMIGLYIKKRGYEVQQAENESSPFRPSFLYADQRADGGQAAREKLRKCMRLRLSAEDTSFTLDFLIGKYLFELDLERQELHEVLRTARELKKDPPDSIVGYELLDVVLEKTPLLAKVISFRDPQPWAFLAEETPVLVVEDLGRAIVTSEPHTLCDRWKQVPAGRNYLVATVPAIHYLIEGRGGFKLSDQIRWDFSDSLINSHTIGSKSTVLHTQKLRSVEKHFLAWNRDQQNDPRPLLSGVSNGAFIFGPSGLIKACTATLSHMGTQMVCLH